MAIHIQPLSGLAHPLIGFDVTLCSTWGTNRTNDLNPERVECE